LKLSLLIAGFVCLSIGAMMIVGGGLLQSSPDSSPIKVFDRTFQDPTPGTCSKGVQAATVFGLPQGSANSHGVITGFYAQSTGAISGLSIRAWLSGSTRIMGQPAEDDLTGCPGDSRSVSVTWRLKYVCPPPSFGAICEGGYGATTQYLDKFHRWIFVPGSGVTIHEGDWVSLEIQAWGLPSYYYAWLSAENVHQYPYSSDVALVLWGGTPPPDEPEPPDRDPCPEGQHWDDERQECVPNYSGGGGDSGPVGLDPGSGAASGVVCPPGTEYNADKADPWSSSEMQNMTDQRLKDYGICEPPPTDILGVLLLGVAVLLIIVGLTLLFVGFVT